MQISYKTNRLEKSVESPKAIQKNYGTRAKQIALRLMQFKAAGTLDDIRNLPQARWHELSGNRKGELAVDISGNSRIIFVPNDVPLPKKEDGGLDWTQITKIKITEIGTDYH